MVQFRPRARELIAKVVYYGPPLGGKTTNLKSLYAGYPEDVRGELIIVPAGTDRTIFFDFLPLELGTLRGMKVRVQLYTVPGQVHYNATRQVVLRGVDGVVFVADSQRTLLANNRESWENLKDNLLLQGMSLDEVPHVLQYNKRDLKDISSIAELDELLNDFNAPFFEAVAPEGIGVEETLQAIVKLVIRSLRDRFRLEGGQATTQPIYYPPNETAEDVEIEVEFGASPGGPAPQADAPVAPPAQSPASDGEAPVSASPAGADADAAPFDAPAPAPAEEEESASPATTMAEEIAFAAGEVAAPAPASSPWDAGAPAVGPFVAESVEPPVFEAAADAATSPRDHLGPPAPGDEPPETGWTEGVSAETGAVEELPRAEAGEAGGLEVAEPPFGVRGEDREERSGGEGPFEIGDTGAEAEDAGEWSDGAEEGSAPDGELEAGAEEEPDFVWGTANAGEVEAEPAEDPRFEAPREAEAPFAAEPEEDFTQPPAENGGGTPPPDAPFDAAAETEPQVPSWGVPAALAALKGEPDAPSLITDEVEALAPDEAPPRAGTDGTTWQDARPEAPGSWEDRPEVEPWGPGGADVANPQPFEPQAPFRPGPDEEAVLTEDVPPPFEIPFEREPAPEGDAAVFAEEAPPAPEERVTTGTLVELAALDMDDAPHGLALEDELSRVSETDAAVTPGAPLAAEREAPFAELSDPFAVVPPPPEVAGADDVFAIVPVTPPTPPLAPESVVVPVEIAAVKQAASRALARHGEVRELEVEVPVPAVWTGGRRMTFQLRLTLVPQEEDDDR